MLLRKRGTRGLVTGSQRVVRIARQNKGGKAKSQVIEGIQRRVREGDYRFTIHAFERCVERDISPEQIKNAILRGEIIEDYPEDK